MPVETSTLYTASAMAKQLGASEAKVKKAIKDLGLAPVAKKGCCAFYGAEQMAKVQAGLT
ncbi:MAG: hypothetical protein IPP58_10695 [Holophagaceae bacterium]|uniref:Uncharacterized protein n=1 Tax=Candidatus Geothrix skivensis TaxID=2954439 RepID=A0A9D7SGB5_9BACT|nr:hypothetical protein [Candidatus Geothrix skivensis]